MSARDVLGDGWVKVIERASRLCTSQSLAHCRFASTAALSRIASASSCGHRTRCRGRRPARGQPVTGDDRIAELVVVD
jgi:hypothetical protein